MNALHTRWPQGLGAALTLLTLAALAPAPAAANDCSDLPAQLSQDPLRAEGFRVVAASNLYRRQDRPYDQIPSGARVLLRTPAHVTEAGLHRALSCRIGPNSPLAVPGARLGVHRIGELYEVRITADLRSAALEIQHRVAAL